MDYVRTLGGTTPRSGRHDRANSDRYFHVMNQGWYALTREGIKGPFVEKRDAEEFIARIVSGELQPEPRDVNHAGK